MPRIEPVPWADVPEKNASAWSTPSRMADRRRTRRLRVSWPIRCTSTCRMMATVIIITRASTAGQAPGDAAHPQRTARRLRSLQECTQGRRGDRGGCRLRRQPPRLRMTESGQGGVSASSEAMVFDFYTLAQLKKHHGIQERDARLPPVGCSDLRTGPSYPIAPSRGVLCAGRCLKAFPNSVSRNPQAWPQGRPGFDNPMM